MRPCRAQICCFADPKPLPRTALQQPAHVLKGKAGPCRQLPRSAWDATCLTLLLLHTCRRPQPEASCSMHTPTAGGQLSQADGMQTWYLVIQIQGISHHEKPLMLYVACAHRNADTLLVLPPHIL